MAKIQPTVYRSRYHGQKRKGRGFSLAELKAAGVALLEARRMGLPLDARRRSTHPENVEALKRLREA